MADTIQIDTGVLASCSNEMDASRQKMLTIAEQATGVVNALAGTWTGTASDAFKNAWGQAQQKLQNAGVVIAEYVGFLNSTIEEYEATESARTADNASFEGGN